uniref:Uncharacterized protein n=1 Tax=Timema monikensis TaxID=170555 RepID=A0A7R9HUT3_9NEOP|nr:unnamed protein product [Timema monikensis]
MTLSAGQLLDSSVAREHWYTNQRFWADFLCLGELDQLEFKNLIFQLRWTAELLELDHTKQYPLEI